MALCPSKRGRKHNFGENTNCVFLFIIVSSQTPVPSGKTWAKTENFHFLNKMAPFSLHHTVFSNTSSQRQNVGENTKLARTHFCFLFIILSSQTPVANGKMWAKTAAALLTIVVANLKFILSSQTPVANGKMWAKTAAALPRLPASSCTAILPVCMCVCCKYLRVVNRHTQSCLRVVNRHTQSCLLVTAAILPVCMCVCCKYLRVVKRHTQSCLRVVNRHTQSCLLVTAAALPRLPASSCTATSPPVVYIWCVCVCV